MEFKLKSTSNYGLFKTLEGNRPIIAAHVTEIEKKIEDRGYMCMPILVNEKMEIIEGQHRLETLKKLGMPVYYIVQPGLGLKDCMCLNSGTKNWVSNNYINAQAVAGNTNYIYLQQLMKQFPDLTFTVVSGAAAMAGGQKSFFKNKEIQNGYFLCDSEAYEKAGKLLSFFRDIKPCFHYGGQTQYYASAIFYALLRKDISWDTMRKNLYRHQLDLAPAANTLQALAVIEKAYNNRTRKKVYLTAEYKKERNIA